RRANAVQNVILPALRKPVPEVAVVCDTSASMSEKLLGQVLAEIDGLVRGVGLGPGKLRVVPCDATAHAVQRVSSAAQVQLIGGGGTDMGEGIAACRRLRPPASV